MNEVRFLDESSAINGARREEVLGALRTAFLGLLDGTSVQPAQSVTVFPEDAGDCIFYPGALLANDVVGVKVSPYLGALASQGKYPVTAYTLLLSTKTGQPTLLCGSYALTASRTAGTTALAVDYLAPRTGGKLSIIGSSKLAVEHYKYAKLVRQWESISLYSPSLATNRERQESWIALSDGEVSFAPDAQTAVDGASVVMLCTSSGTPVVDLSWCASDALVTSISTNSPGAHEISPQDLPSLRVFCDYRETAPVTAGEMKIAIEDGSWRAEQIVGDLPELAAGLDVSPHAGARKFFRSTGLGVEDLAIASLLV